MLSILIILLAAYGSAAVVGVAIVISRTKLNIKEIKQLFLRKSFGRLIQSIIFVLIFLVILFVCLSFYFPEFGNKEWINQDNGTPLLILVTGILATIGWIFSIHAQERNLAKEQAHRMIANSIHDPVIAAHKQNIFTQFPPNINVSSNDIPLLIEEQSQPANYKYGKYPIYYSIIQVLNVYEAMAIGIKSDKIDEYIVKDYIGAIIKISCTKKFKSVIIHVRKPGEDSIRPKSYDTLVWLLDRWFDIDLDDPIHR